MPLIESRTCYWSIKCLLMDMCEYMTFLWKICWAVHYAWDMTALREIILLPRRPKFIAIKWQMFRLLNFAHRCCQLIFVEQLYTVVFKSGCNTLSLKYSIACFLCVKYPSNASCSRYYILFDELYILIWNNMCKNLLKVFCWYQ